VYPDPDVIVIDPSFRTLVAGNSPIRRVWTGVDWAEGRAWSSQGLYLVFSDVTGNTQYRYIWEDGRVTPFRKPSYIPTAIPSTIRGGSSPARISSAVSCAGNMTAR
jgi:sugar lactone lactonase YvrE